MSLKPGQSIGPHKVVRLLGEGGMGQVWQATDTQLNRDVALKILPDAFAGDPDRLARFKREAQILASLNHPNIAAIYGIEEAEPSTGSRQGAVRALVLELVEGPTLADRIAQGAMPIEDALPIARQIAEALEAAHEAGVIHRDLKPANIKVREDGTVKVLDFGLAKALDPNPEGDPSQSPTLTAAATQMGVIMGTAAYMSPEQAAGQTSDKRSDAWSFGVVLYEMLTGQRLFTGETVSHVLAKVLDRELDLSALTTSTPPPIRRLLRRCLERKPKRRLSDLGEALSHLEEALAPVEEAPSAVPSVPPVVQPAGWRQALPLALGISAVAVVITGLAVWAITRSVPQSAPDLMRFAIVPPDDAALTLLGNRQDLTISPDGTQIVYVGPAPGGVPQLNLRPVDQLVGAPLRGGEGGVDPFVSPDGEWVGFRVGTVLRKLSIFGGSPVTLTESPSGVRGASWGTDDQIIFGTIAAGLFRVSGGGGEPEALTALDTEQGQQSHRWPSIIPGREAVVFAVGTATGGGGFLTSGQLAVLDLDTGVVTRLGLAGVSPHYVSTGHLVYAAADGSVRAVPFDATSLEVTGNPVPLVERVVVKGSGAAEFSISDSGRLVYTPDDEDRNLTSRLLVTGRDGAGTSLAEIDGLAWYPRFSPDGTHVAFAVSQDGSNSTEADVWVLDVGRGTQTRLTFGGTNNRFYPVWSPDGTRVAYADGSGSTNRVLATASDGSGETETLLDRDERQFPMSWSPDGSALALYQGGIGVSRDLTILPLDGDDRTPVPFLSTPFEERGVSFSPNGQWLAYVSNESGQDEIYVRPYPGPGGEEIVSTGGGEEAVWGPDGSELFYRNGDQVMIVQVSTGPTWSAETPVPLFPAPYVLDNAAGGGGNPNYDVAPDGERFIFVERDSPGAPPQINVVLNWFEELKARVPVP